MATNFLPSNYFGGTGTTKDKIISLFVEEKNLTTKQIHFLLKKRYSINVTYQAVHKTLKQMIEQGILNENDRIYSISKIWVENLVRFTNVFSQDKQSRIQQPIEISKTTHLYNFENMHQMEKFYIEERDKYFAMSQELPVKERIICVHAPHQYFSLMSAQVEYEYIKQLMRTKTIHYSLVKGNSVVDKWIKKFYESKLDSPYKIRIGTNCSTINEMVVYPKKIIELHYSETFWNFYSELYDSVEKFEDLNITKIMDDLYVLKNEPIKCIVHTDSSMIRLAQDETLALFDIKKSKPMIYKSTGTNKDVVADLWSISIKFLYSKEYLKNLVKFLKQNKIKKILDCGCGTGFPAIDLKKNGFDVHCVDSDANMLTLFRKNCEVALVSIPLEEMDWRDIKKLNQKFDAVMCRGNSLIYVDSWDRYFDQKRTMDSIKEALASMYFVLEDGGLLYVDITAQAEYDQGPRLTEKFGEKIIDGKSVKLTWDVTHDWKERKRVVKSIREINGDKFEYNYYSFLLKHQELMDLLSEVGFKKVESIEINGETGYSVFIAHK